MTLPCRHDSWTSVDSAVTGEVVAQLCLSCGRQLPVNWGDEDYEPSERRQVAESREARVARSWLFQLPYVAIIGVILWLIVAVLVFNL